MANISLFVLGLLIGIQSCLYSEGQGKMIEKHGSIDQEVIFYEIKYCKKSNKHHFWAEMAKAGVVQHFG